MTTAQRAAPAADLDSERLAVLAAHLLVQRALELAGKRLLTRAVRGNYGGDLRHLHEQVPVSAEQVPRLLAGAFDWVPETAPWVAIDGDRLAFELSEYVGGLLLAGRPHDVRYLPSVIRKARAA